VKTSNNCPAKESKQEASNIEILATVTGKGISDATEVLSAATHAICVPTPEAQATLNALGITNTPTEVSHTPKDIKAPEELIAQIKSYETEIQLMALKGQNPELEARARELDDLIDPLRKQLREYHMANIRGPVSAPNASDSEYLSENVVPVATLVDLPATSKDDLSPASPWIETGACPVCSGDLALYRQLFPADGAHAEWVCLSSEWQHRLSPRLYDSSTHVLKNGTEYRDIPTSELPWLEKYRAMGNPGGPPGRRYICDQCYQPRLDVVPVMNGMHHCGDCREPGDEHPYQQVQQDLEKKRAAQLQQLQQLQQNHQATEKGN
jgi:Skp family chaperone for outer membrane proteins